MYDLISYPFCRPSLPCWPQESQNTLQCIQETKQNLFCNFQTSDKYIVYDNGTFIINDVTEDDEAFYTCNVGNVFGEMSESTALTVTGNVSVKLLDSV